MKLEYRLIIWVAALATLPPAAARGQESAVPAPSAEAAISDGVFAPAAPPWWTWQAGAEATYLSLEYRAVEVSADPEFLGAPQFGFEAAPRIWLQAENGDGWGGQVRYWQYDADAATRTDIFIPAPDEFTGTIYGFADVTSQIELYAIDAEVTRSLLFDRGAVLATFGGRHASIAEATDMTAIDESNNSDFDFFSIHTRTEFHGGGLTGSLLGILPLGDSRWELVGGLRGSALWGHEHRGGFITLLNDGVVQSGSGNILIDGAQLSILEAQAGLQWTHELVNLRGLLFVRTVFEYQRWNTTAVDPEHPNIPSRLDAELYGLSCAVGFMR